MILPGRLDRTDLFIGKTVSFLIWAGLMVLCDEVVARFGFGDARRKLARWRDDDTKVRPRAAPGNRTPAEVRRTLEQRESSAPGALARPETGQHHPQGLSL